MDIEEISFIILLVAFFVNADIEFDKVLSQKLLNELIFVRFIL